MRMSVLETKIQILLIKEKGELLTTLLHVMEADSLNSS